MKNIIINCVLLSSLFISCKKVERSQNIIPKHKTIEFMGEEFYDEWREPTNSEFASISSILIKNNTSQCANFYVIKTRNNEFVVACTSDEKWFNYYGVWVSTKESGKLNDDVLHVSLQPNEIEKDSLKKSYD